MLERLKSIAWLHNYQGVLKVFENKAESALFYAGNERKKAIYSSLWKLRGFKELPQDKKKLILGTCILHNLDLVDAQINAHYWMQTLLRPNVGRQVLRPWRHKETYFPTNHGTFRFGAIKIDSLAYLRSLALDYSSLLERVKEQDGLKAFVRAAIFNEPLLLLSNHSGWQNLPFLATVVHDILGCSLNRMTTVIGPAVANLHLANSVANLTNLIVTIPPSNHGALPDFLNVQQRNISARALKAMVGLKKKKVAPILILCPFGTTDKQDKDEILLQNYKSAMNVTSLLAKRGYKVFTVATYDEHASLSGAKLNKGGRVNVRFAQVTELKARKVIEGLAHDLEEISNKKVILS